ncbi:MAG: MBL fold metallo-hydrolase [Lachnospiraceae bacterium]|nr:MBL fold metallo-hydrolase [Lachnospiraceae bacterium]
MQNNNLYEYKEIRNNIWQIAEDSGVYCTLIKGNEMAILIDTGYGHRNLREFVEKNVSTPYMVINSHGHPDHIGGNHWFDTIYAVKEEWDVIDHFEEEPRNYELKEIQTGSQISLGNLHIDIISLAGHTKGSIGFWVREEGILVAGDALNENLWLFNYGALSMKQLYGTLNKTIHLDFDSYLCGHSDQEYKKEKMLTHIRNIENLKTDEETKQNTIGFETYCSSYEDVNGKSEIVFTISNLCSEEEGNCT